MSKDNVELSLSIFILISLIIIGSAMVYQTERAKKYESAIRNYEICYNQHEDTDCSIYLQDVYTFEDGE